MMRGGMGRGGAMMQPRTSKQFRATVRRLAGCLRPELAVLVLVLVLASASVVFLVVGPKVIGRATDQIFNGVVGKQLPAGISKQQAIAGLRAQGHGQIAELVSGMDVHPGVG